MWRISVNPTCIGSGSCVGIAPARFQIDDGDNRAHPVDPQVEPDDIVLDAVFACPMEAISVVDVETGEPVDA
jgi:ferredoxin